MHVGLVISICMHAAILGWTFMTFQSLRGLRAPETEPIAVGVVAPSEVTKVRLGVPTAKQLEAEAKDTPKADAAKKEAAKPKPAAATLPPPPPPEPPAAKEKLDPIAQKLAEAPPPPAAPPAVPAPDEQKKLDAVLQDLERQARERLKAGARPADEQRKADEKAEEQGKAEQQRKVAEEKRAEEQRAEERRLEEQRRQAGLKRQEAEKKRKDAERKRKLEEEKKRQAEAAKQKQFDADKISALLNRAPDKGAPPPSAVPMEPPKAKGPALGAPDARDKQISASELAMINQIVKSCVMPRWNVLSGGASAQETKVKIRLQFNPNGTLSTPPEIVNPQRSPYFVAISESAVRAVQQCEPFSLPAAKYEAWRDIVLNFQPRDMY